MVQILSNLYVDATRTYSNTIKEVADVLGIEAALLSVVREINQILKSYDIFVDHRHLTLVANLMCNREKIMGMTRHGMNRLEDIGPLVRASFEETSVILKNAARFGEIDHFKGVSSSIIVGTVPPIGTGKVEVMLDVEKLQKSQPRYVPPSTRKIDSDIIEEVPISSTSPIRSASPINPLHSKDKPKTSARSEPAKRFCLKIDDLVNSFRSKLSTGQEDALNKHLSFLSACLPLEKSTKPFNTMTENNQNLPMANRRNTYGNSGKRTFSSLSINDFPTMLTPPITSAAPMMSAPPIQFDYGENMIAEDPLAMQTASTNTNSVLPTGTEIGCSTMLLEDGEEEFV